MEHMTYQSVTTWQANDFEVEIRYGFFGTVADAESMARNGIEGIFVDGGGLWVDLSDGTRAPVRDGGFVVRRLHEASRAQVVHRALTIEDFEVVQMSAKDIRNEPCMRSFGSQSYGVIDASGKPVELPLQD